MKLTRIILVLVFTFSFSNALVANSATIKNGTKCTKLNSTTKVDGKTYRCGKNPIFKPTSLTWTLKSCFAANRYLKDAKSQYEDFKDLAKIAGQEGEKALLDLETSISELEALMRDEVCKKGA